MIFTIHTVETFFETSQAEFINAYLKFELMDIPTKLFEVAQNLRAIPVACNFVDVGRYSSLYQLLPKDGERNAVVGSAILRGDCRGNLAINHTDKPLVIIDQQDMVIVQTSEGNVCAPYASIDTIGAIYKSELLG